MNRKRLLGIALAAACRSSEPAPIVANADPVPVGTVAEPKPVPPKPEPAKPRRSFPQCVADTSFELKLRGLTQAELEDRYGAPATRELFRAEERQGEFYSGIEDAFPSTDPKNRNGSLEEWTWKTGDCTLTVWFHQHGGAWRVLDDVYWHRNIEF